MRSTWVEHKGKKILYQDFSQNFYNSAVVKTELEEVKKIDLPSQAPVRRMRYLPWAAAIGLLLLAGGIYRLTQHRTHTAPVGRCRPGTGPGSTRCPWP